MAKNLDIVFTKAREVAASAPQEMQDTVYKHWFPDCAAHYSHSFTGFTLALVIELWQMMQ